MKTIGLIVEGDGEREALPVLLRKMSASYDYEVQFKSPRAARSISKFLKQYEPFLKQERDERPDGVLVLIDCDDDCPVELAYGLAAQAQNLNLPFPVVIVCAYREYETWFLASLESIAGQSIKGTILLPEGLTYPGEVENRRGAKEWLKKQASEHTKSSGLQVTYREKFHQAPMSSLLDPDLVRSRSRSFRRLEHALEEVMRMSSGVSPHPQKGT